MTRLDNTRHIRSPRGTDLSCKSWLTEAPMRMLMNIWANHATETYASAKPELEQELAKHGERGTKINGCRALADAAFLIYEGDNPTQPMALSRTAR